MVYSLVKLFRVIYSAKIIYKTEMNLKFQAKSKIFEKKFFKSAP